MRLIKASFCAFLILLALILVIDIFLVWGHFRPKPVEKIDMIYLNEYVRYNVQTEIWICGAGFLDLRRAKRDSVMIDANFKLTQFEIKNK